MPKDDNMVEYDFADKRFETPPFDPFKWNEYMLEAMTKGKSQKGNDKYLLRFRAIHSDYAVFHTISYSDDGRMNFQRDNEKILLCLVQNNEKTYAEALRKAIGNSKVTLFIKCDIEDGKYVRIKEAKKAITAEDKMNEGLENEVKSGAAKDDDDLPM